MKLDELMEEIRPNQYFRVLVSMRVWEGRSTGSYSFPSYDSLDLNEGDELHWLHGGLFAIKDGKAIRSISVDNPNRRGEGEFYSHKRSPDRYRSAQLEKLIQSGQIEAIDKANATQVRYA